MKIRTDFVTNSSSYSSAEIIIDNPVLLEILQKYKDTGLFGGIGIFYNIGSYEIQNLNGVMEGSGKTKTPAFCYFNDEVPEINYTPTKIDEVLSFVLRAIDDIRYETDDDFDEGIYSQVKEEINHQKDEISCAYNFVRWVTSHKSTEDDGDFPGAIVERHDYRYVKGGEERYHKIEVGDNYETNERITFVDILIIDGKEVINIVQETPGDSEEDLL